MLGLLYDVSLINTKMNLFFTPKLEITEEKPMDHYNGSLSDRRVRLSLFSPDVYDV